MPMSFLARREAGNMDITLTDQLETGLSASEVALLREVVHALRSVRYGSVNLTVHDGHLVEIQKVEKIRIAPKARRD